MGDRNLKQPTHGPSNPVQNHGYDASSDTWPAINVDASGHPVMKLAVEVEIAGTPINCEAFDASASGTNTLATASASQQFKLYKAFLSVSATLSGVAALFVGTKRVGAINSPIPGGNHILISGNPDYVLGSAGASIAIVLPSGQDVITTLHYE